ncbi:DNA mismatch repair protein MutS [Candidatus Babeliales bacterium]|nr:DNA mismatch repair protein MutS [Candidatus Babeliales bacterium]
MIISKTTPLMQQYFKIKEQYKDTLLLFQVGDFYELFFDDAKKASSFLAIALTKRGKNNGKDIPLCGIPVHVLNHYLIKLVGGGFRVAVCDQLEKPQPGKVVKRGVTQVFTPATLTDSVMLDEKSASYMASFFPQKDCWGLVFAELLTAQLFATILPAGAFRMVESELIRFFPDEIIIPDLKTMKSFSTYFRQLGYLISFCDYDLKNQDGSCSSWMEKQFSSKILEVIAKKTVINSTLNTLYYYLKKNQIESLKQFSTIKFYTPDDYLILDSATQKNLEIVKNNQDFSRKNTLLQIMDKAKTSMGSRMIKKWLLRPLIQESKILQRQNAVSVICSNIDLMQQLEQLICNISDLERIVGRIALRRAVLNDYLSLKNSLAVLPDLKLILQKVSDTFLIKLILERMLDFSSLVQLLECSLNDDLSFKWIIKKGFDHKLDKLREFVEDGQLKILKLEQKESARTGIGSLKIRYNHVSGYYIEVTNPNLHLVPSDYIEKQKLVNRKRFVTQELKNLEQELFKAQNEIEHYEQEVFERVKNEVITFLNYLRSVAQDLASLDAIFSFAKIAYENNYVAPSFNEKREIIIEKGRHPVIEQKLDNNFQSNDTILNNSESLLIITGPNMGGKSTYLRQVALICIMAQCGSFVPAQKIDLPILDRIFTRIGASDNLAQGKSTFLVEMEEAASICTRATKKSLVILDEVGRGTSTFDGIALAQAIIEYIYQNVEARCLFATHFHELTNLSKHFNGIANYFMTSKKIGNNLIFLHKITPGVSGGSFGIEVAKLAHLPEKVIERAVKLLKKMEEQTKFFSGQKILQKQVNMFHDSLNEKINVMQKKLFEYENIFHKLENINLEELSPKKAFDLLWEIKSK